MALREELEATGSWLFHRRGYLPLLLFPLLIVAARQSPWVSGDPRAGAWQAACVLVALCGLCIRVLTAGFVPTRTSGRSTTRQQAGTLNTLGLYSVVRHPLYLGNALMWLGVCLFPAVWWPPVIAGLIGWLYYERIMFAEEEFLRRQFGLEYERWAAVTPAFIPRPSLWRRAPSSFSTLTVLRREHASLLALVSSFAALDAVGDLAATGRLAPDPVWSVIFGVTLVLCLTIRLVKHRTRLLHVEGR